jgi:hypothetical protein
MMVVVALVARPAPSAKRSDVLDLRAEDVEAWWERAAWGLRTGLQLLREDCGLVSPNWLPYNTMLMPLAAILAKNGLPTGPAAGAARQKLTRWYWCSVFGQRYESSPSSQMARDVTEVTTWLAGGGEPEAIRNFRFDPRLLHDTTPRQRAVYRGVITLILRRHPRDFHHAARITSETIVEQGIDDHHVLPQAYLAAVQPLVSPGLRDCVLNRTLIDSKTNKSLGKKPPSVYLREIEAHLGTDALAALLESHLLPAGSDGPLEHDDFEGFLRWREEAVWRDIQHLTGVTEASDLIDDDEEIPA